MTNKLMNKKEWFCDVDNIVEWRHIITLLLVLVTLTVQGQTNKDSIYVYGIVADGFTKAAVPDAFVTLMRQDSTVVDTISVHDSHTWVSGVQRTRRVDARRTHPTAAERGTD